MGSCGVPVSSKSPPPPYTHTHTHTFTIVFPAKLVPVAYGIMKLQISCVIEDEKVGTDFLEESITAFEDHVSVMATSPHLLYFSFHCGQVQSVDVVAFNKI